MTKKKTGGKDKVDGKSATAGEKTKKEKDRFTKPKGVPPPLEVRKKFRHTLGVKCSDSELLKAGKELAKCHADRDHIVLVLTEAKKKAAADTEPITTRISELLRILDSGERQVDTTCERVIDYKSNRTQFFRTDTGDMFHERVISNDEKQRHFQFFNPDFDIDG